MNMKLVYEFDVNEENIQPSSFSEEKRKKSCIPVLNKFSSFQLPFLMSFIQFVHLQGLPNLGNTCFYNSVMQCVMHTHQLVHYLQWFGRVRSVHVPTRTLLVNEEKIQLEVSIFTLLG